MVWPCASMCRSKINPGAFLNLGEGRSVCYKWFLLLPTLSLEGGSARTTSVLGSTTCFWWHWDCVGPFGSCQPAWRYSHHSKPVWAQFVFVWTNSPCEISQVQMAWVCVIFILCCTCQSNLQKYLSEHLLISGGKNLVSLKDLMEYCHAGQV